jgi:cyclomaltodextrin glucanotransferase
VHLSLANGCYSPLDLVVTADDTTHGGNTIAYCEYQVDGGGWGPMEKVFKGGDYSKADEILKHDGEYKDASYLVTYLDNHDKPRFSGGTGEAAPAERYFDALNFYFTARGIPCIFYGTEIRMPGGEDPDNRRMLGAGGIEKAKSDPVYAHLQKLNAIRRSALPLRRGAQTRLLASPNQYAFRRDYGGETAAVFLNKDEKTAQLKASGLPDGNWRELYTGSRLKVKGGVLETEVPAHGLRVFVNGKIKGSPWKTAEMNYERKKN